jgi:hypothetical protein
LRPISIIFRHSQAKHLTLNSEMLDSLDDRFKNLLGNPDQVNIRGAEAYEHRRQHFALPQIVRKNSVGRYFAAPRLLRKTPVASMTTSYVT